MYLVTEENVGGNPEEGVQPSMHLYRGRVQAER